jgi:hypothetical protein
MQRFWFLLMISLAACGGSGGSGSSGGPALVTMEIDHHRAPCTGEGRFLCLRARDKGEADFTFMYGGITGFEHQWGHTYVLEVEETPVPDPPADGSSIERSLKSVVSDTPVTPGTTFVVKVEGSDLALNGSAGGTLLSSAPFTCADAAVCDAANQVVMGGTTADLTFGYPDPVGLPLVLQKVEPN